MADGVRFHHALVRDVAYGRLTAGERLRLHARYACEGVPPDHAESLAHHQWQAVGVEDADWVWQNSAELAELRIRARAAHLAAARRYAARFAHGRAIDTCRRAFRFSSTPVETAQVEQTLADVYASSGDADEAAAHYLRARDLYRSEGAPPADLYPSFLEHVVYTSGMFRLQMDPARIDELLDEGERVARQAGDTASLARIIGLRAYRSHDGARLSDALRLTDAVADAAALASFLSPARSFRAASATSRGRSAPTCGWMRSRRRWVERTARIPRNSCTSHGRRGRGRSSGRAVSRRHRVSRPAPQNACVSRAGARASGAGRLAGAARSSR